MLRSRTSLVRVPRAMSAALCLAVMSLAVAACGSNGGSPSSGSGTGPSDSQSSANIAPFEAAVKTEEAVPTYQGPTSGPKPQPGKKLAVITCASVNSGCVSIAHSVQQAAAAVGWHVTIMDGKGSPSVTSQDMITAINQGVDGIVLAAIQSNTVLQGMKAAQKAHVPVVSVVSGSPMGSAVEDVYAEISGQTFQSGKELADYFIVQSKGTAKVAEFHVPSLASTVQRWQGFNAEIKKCAGCTVVSNQTYGLVSQSTFESQVKGVLNAHPNIQYIFVDISQYATIAATAVHQLGLVGKVGVVGIDCLPPEVQSIKGNTGEIACADDAVSESGWATVNELTRAFAGLSALHEAYPLRLLNKSDLTGATPPYLGGFSPAAGYKKLWGITG